MSRSGDDNDADGVVSRTEVLPPTRLLAGKYRLGRLLGEGGMGAVYEGEHTGLGSRVAVKLLSEHLQNERAVARFRREARAMAAVRHDNVVTVTDTGTDEEGTPFLVMELLDGESLNGLIKRERRLRPEAAVPIAVQILSGLAAAHDRGIVHRDLKPGNIFVSVGAEGDRRVKILDFGISKFAEGATRELTAEGTMIGTPHYMAPEQARGHKDIDARADLYSVGVLLYRMLTGRLPFDQKPSEGLYEAIFAAEPKPPREHVADIPAELEEVILRAMSKKPGDRYPDARAMRAALLEAVPDLETTGTLPPSVPSWTPPPGGEMGTARTVESAQTRRATPPGTAASDDTNADSTRAAKPSAGSRSDRPPAPSSTGGTGAAPTPAPVGDASTEAEARRVAPALWLVGVLAIAGTGAAVWAATGSDGSGGTADGADVAEAGGEDEGEVAPAPAGEPLAFGITQYMSPEQVRERHSPLTDYLSERLGRPVELDILEDHQDIGAALASGDVAMAALSPYWYVRAKEQAPGLHLVATPVRRGNLETYVGQIVVRADSDIASIDDLEGKLFCYAGRHSTSGYIYPSALLRRLGYDPHGHFGGVVFADGQHLKALRYLMEGACDGAAVYGTATQQAAEEGIAPMEAFHVLRSTDRMPYDAYVVSPRVDDGLVARIREALLALERGSEQAEQIMGPADVIGFEPADDAAYDTVREEIRALDEAQGNEVEP